jgi:hypothetical protein
LGENYGNTLYKDIMYAKLLVNNSKFVTKVNKGGATEWIPLEQTEEILNC